jgi:hypothetical protein
LRRGADHVVELVGAVLGRFERIDFVVPGAEGVKAGGDERFVRGVGQFIAGELLGDEAVVGFVGVQGGDDVVAIAPDAGLGAVALVAARVGVADQVEPVAGPALAIAGIAEESVGEALVGVGSPKGI